MKVFFFCLFLGEGLKGGKGAASIPRGGGGTQKPGGVLFWAPVKGTPRAKISGRKFCSRKKIWGGANRPKGPETHGAQKFQNPRQVGASGGTGGQRTPRPAYFTPGTEGFGVLWVARPLTFTQKLGAGGPRGGGAGQTKKKTGESPWGPKGAISWNPANSAFPLVPATAPPGPGGPKNRADRSSCFGRPTRLFFKGRGWFWRDRKKRGEKKGGLFQ